MKMRVIVLFLILGMLGSACAAISFPGAVIAPPGSEVYAVHIGSTVNGIRSAINMNAGTSILARKDLMMFVWTIEDAWAFVTVSAKSGSPIKDLAIVSKAGNLVNCKTMKELISVLKMNGWKSVPASAVPNALKVAVNGATVAELMRWAGNTLSTFLVLPVGAVLPPEYILYEGVLQ